MGSMKSGFCIVWNKLHSFKAFHNYLTHFRILVKFCKTNQVGEQTRQTEIAENTRLWSVSPTWRSISPTRPTFSSTTTCVVVLWMKQLELYFWSVSNVWNTEGKGPHQVIFRKDWREIKCLSITTMESIIICKEYRIFIWPPEVFS